MLLKLLLICVLLGNSLLRLLLWLLRLRRHIRGVVHVRIRLSILLVRNISLRIVRLRGCDPLRLLRRSFLSWHGRRLLRRLRWRLRPLLLVLVPAALLQLGRIRLRCWWHSCRSPLLYQGVRHGLPVTRGLLSESIGRICLRWLLLHAG